MNELLSDLRTALRVCRRSWAVSLLAVVTLGLGLGASVAVFSVLHAVVLQPLPYPDPQDIVHLSREHSYSAAQIRELSTATHSFDALVPAAGGSLVLLSNDTPRGVGAAIVDEHFDRVFGGSVQLGRSLQASDSLPGAEPVVVLSHAFWKKTFGGDAQVVGRSLQLSGEGATERTVVGVATEMRNPFPWPSEVLVPIRHEPGAHDDRDMFRYWLLGRLRDGVGTSAARNEVRDLTRLLAASDPALFSQATVERADVTTYLASLTATASRSLWLVFGAVGVVLVVACCNITLLLLGRSVARRQELAVRKALGASRGRLLRQQLTESLLLSLSGGLLGIAVAAGTLRLLQNLMPPLHRSETVGLDSKVLLFAFALSAVAGVASGLVPAWRSSRGSSEGHGVRTTARSAGSRAVSPGVVAQVALALVLTSCAGLLLKSFSKLQDVDPGFDPERVVSLRLSPPAANYSEESQRQDYFRRVVEAVGSVPGVESVGAGNLLPLSRGVLGVGISPDGGPVPEGEPGKLVSYRTVTPGYFETLELRLLEGRLPTAQDRVGAAPVGLINRRLASELWPDQQATGREVRWGTGEAWFRVIGVVDDTRQRSLAEAASPEVYLPFAQEAWVPTLHLVVKTRDHEPALAPVREAIWQIDGNVPIARETSLEALLQASLASERFYLVLFGSFSVLTLILGSLGVYGTTSFRLHRATREIGIRMALGASRRRIVADVLTRTLSTATAGVVVGLGVAIASARLLTGMLFDVRPADPTVLVVVALLLLLVALSAASVPAWRAARTDPQRALRSD